MELSLAGFLGAVAGTALGVANFVMAVGYVAARLRALDKSETAAQREEFETKISVMRRLVLGIDIFAFGALGYWLGKKFLGPALGID
jgi:hypothetical protein